MNNQIIYLAGGCFWGTEEYIRHIKGVIETQVGYALGKKETISIDLPETVTYEQVCNHIGHAETVKVIYDNDILPLQTLLTEYSYTIDPTSIGRQGMDIGIQYRTGIYYTTETQKCIAELFLEQLQTQYDRNIQIELLPLLQFVPAEEYHQKYLLKNPNGYCHINFEKIAKMKQKIVNPDCYQKQTKQQLQQSLTPLQYAVTQQNETEPPFSHPYWNLMQEGIYVDVTTGEPLFSSKDKFVSLCGWPSFRKPIDPNVIQEYDDCSHDMIRTEVRSRVGNAHLGHVFDELEGLRYCINGASLRFIKKEDMEKEGYGSFLQNL